MRLKAWWDGNELSVAPRKPAAMPAPEPEPAYRAPKQPWETPRVCLLQAVWGQGFSGPGDKDYVLQLVQPFGLTPAMSMLDLGAGLGGPARAFVDAFGAWVTGYEADRELAQAGMELSTMAGHAKQAAISPFDAATFELRPTSLDCALSRETLFAIAGKPRMLEQIQQALKPRGQLLITDFVLRALGADQSAAIQDWVAGEPAPPHLWTLEQYKDELIRLKFDIRVAEDITPLFRASVLGGWAKFTASAAALEPELNRCLVEEVELWTRRIAALDSGELGVVRLYMVKPASRTLSDW